MDAAPATFPAQPISRRLFLAGLTTAGLSVSGLETGPEIGSAPQLASRSRAQPVRAIDIHHHYIPPELLEEAKNHSRSLGVEVSENNRGQTVISFMGARRRDFTTELTDMESRLTMMRDGKLAMAAVEAQTSGVGYALDGDKGEAWCRLYNEGIRELVRQHPGRFLGLAVVPMQDPPRAAAVLEHAIVDLKFSGALITSNCNGNYYNSEEFDPFWAKAEELDVLVVMHPNDVAGAERMSGYGLLTVCGNPADSTLSMGYLIYSGVFDRFPGLKLCVFHGGGFFPYHIGRFDQNHARASGDIAAKSPPSAYLKNLYFDTLVYTGETLDYLRRVAGPDRLLLGTDYPFDLGDWRGVEKVEALDCPESEKDLILHGNARRLLKNIS
jgi:aminocarboxymuconate-semialdehyde decarboxylase